MVVVGINDVVRRDVVVEFPLALVVDVIVAVTEVVVVEVSTLDVAGDIVVVPIS